MLVTPTVRMNTFRSRSESQDTRSPTLNLHYVFHSVRARHTRLESEKTSLESRRAHGSAPGPLRRAAVRGGDRCDVSRIVAARYTCVRARDRPRVLASGSAPAQWGAARGARGAEREKPNMHLSERVLSKSYFGRHTHAARQHRTPTCTSPDHAHTQS